MDRTVSTDDRIVRTDRIACVDLPDLPLQLLLRTHPDWRGLPAAVVAADSPQAPLLWVNESARCLGVATGMRYASALAVCRDLRAAPVPGEQIAAAGESLHRHLLRYSPRVEPSCGEPGVFWLDAGGLERLWGSPAAWAERLWHSLRRARFTAGVTVGFSRFGSYCLARVHRQVVVVTSPAREVAACRDVPLVHLGLAPRLRDDLTRLGLVTIGDLMVLPAAGLAARFGVGIVRLVQLAHGLRCDPLQPVLPTEPMRVEELFEAPEVDARRLLFVVKRLLHPLLDRLADKERAVALLHLDLVLDDRAGSQCRESLRPAAPSLDAVLLLELVRLRLEQADLTAGVRRVALELEPSAAPPTALELFRRRPRRDPAAALRAVARIRAELGDAAVARAELCPGHLPEASWRWRPVTELSTPVPAPPRGRSPLIRRTLPRPRPLLTGPPDLARTHGEQLLRAAAGPGGTSPAAAGFRVHGPHLLSGGWWAREERRVYHFLEGAGGDVLWIFYDEAEGRWYLQGRVE